MPRSRISEQVANAITGSAIPGALVTIVNRSTSNPATIWAADTGAQTLSQPLVTDSDGNIPGWLDDGSYSLQVTPGPGKPNFIATPALFEIVNGIAHAQHVGATANVHGIADTARLITQDNIGVYAPPPNLSAYVTTATLTTHTTATTNVHGIADAARLITIDNIGTYAPAPNLSAYEQISRKGQPNGYAALDASGLIANSALPPLAITDTFVAASQAAQDALTVQTGDVVIRSDTSRSYIWDGTAYKELLSPAAPVQSVNGKIGVVTLTPSDIGASPVGHGHIIADVTTLQATLDGKQPLDATLTTIAGLVTAADRLPYFSGVDVGALTPFTAFGRSLVDDPDAATARTTLGTDAAGVARPPTAHSHIIADVTALQAALDARPASGTINTVANNVLVRPASSGENGVVVKVPDATWGTDPGPYGTRQAFMVLKEDTAGAVEPDDLVLWRVNGKGGMGVSGGIHMATGLRQRPGFTSSYSLHINPYYDCGGIYLDSSQLNPTSPYQQWRERDNTVTPNVATVVAEITNTGVLKAYRTMEARGLNASQTPLLVQGFAAQSANIVNITDSASVSLFNLNPAGYGTFSGGVIAPAVGDPAASGSYVTLNATGVNNGAVQFNTRAIGNTAIRTKPIAGQTANQIEFLDSAGAVKGFVGAGGSILGMPFIVDVGQVGPYVWVTGTTVQIAGRTDATQVLLQTKGVAAQSGDSQQWLDSANVVNGKISATGAYATFMGGVFTPAFADVAATGAYLTTNPAGTNAGSVIANARAATNIPLTIKAAASQSADTLNILNSASAQIFRIGSGGGVFAPNLQAVAGSGPWLQQTGTNVIVENRTTVGNIPLIVKGMASQSGDIQQWQDSTGAELAHVTSDGYFGADRGLFVQAVGFTTRATMIAKGAASQTASLQEWQNSAGSVLAKVDSAGNLTGAGGGFGSAGKPSGYVVAASSWATTDVPLLVKGIASQTGVLTQWQNSAGAVGIVVGPAGDSIGMGPYYTAAAGRLAVSGSNGEITMLDRAASAWQESPTTGQRWSMYVASSQWKIWSQTDRLLLGNSAPLIVKMSASQAANAQEWQDSAGTVLASVDSLGRYSNGGTDARMTFNRPATTNYARIMFQTAAVEDWAIGTRGDRPGLQFTQGASGREVVSLKSVNVSDVTMTVKGMASQTGDLQEWQDSAATILTRIDSAGRLGVGVAPGSSVDVGGVVRVQAVPGATTSFPAPAAGAGFEMGYKTDATYAVVSGGAVGASVFQSYDRTGAVWKDVIFRANDIGFDAGAANRVAIRGGAANVALAVKGIVSQTGDLQQWQDSAGTVLHAITAAGLPRWTAAAAVQTTVGAAGAASALPATPSKYLKIVGDNGTTYVIPAYAAV